jgi:protein-L-isoaspartate(D-aspartate) O-methyltransferase
MVDAAVQRTNMVESQVLPSDVTDYRIARVMSELAREKFVPETMAALAYMDEAILVSQAGGERRWLLAPRVEAKLIQLADIGADDHVLVVGCATGYSAAVIAGLARSVVALENGEALVSEARKNLADAANVSVVSGALKSGWPTKAPYDAMVLPGSVSAVPEDLLDQLKDGGRLVAIVDDGGIGKATVWKRLGRSMDSRVAFDAAAPALPGFAKAPAFVL